MYIRNEFFAHKCGRCMNGRTFMWEGGITDSKEHAMMSENSDDDEGGEKNEKGREKRNHI